MKTLIGSELGPRAVCDEEHRKASISDQGVPDQGVESILQSKTQKAEGDFNECRR